MQVKFPNPTLRYALAVLLVSACLNAQNTVKTAKKQAAYMNSAAANAAPALEPKAIEILKAASARLAAARTMTFTADVTYESPTRQGPPLVYVPQSNVTMVPPNKLRVITRGDGPLSEFYLVAVAEAPPTIHAALQAAFAEADIYFPFTDVIVTDPYAAAHRATISAAGRRTPMASAPHTPMPAAATRRT